MHVCEGLGEDLFSISIPYTFGAIAFFGIFWTVVQYTFIATMAVGLLYTQRITLLILILMGSLGSGINEWGLKHIDREDRPDGACVNGNGFPSGHAVVSITYWSWFLWEVLFRPSWTIKKRIAIFFFLSIVLVPVGPFRTVTRDHSWKQVGVGMGVGFVWGSLFWLLTRFVIIPNLYRIMSWRITQFFHFRNDLRPYYEQSKFEGQIPPKRDVPILLTSNKWVRKNSRDRFLINLYHSILIVAGVALGIVGIIMGIEKKHRDSNCDRVAPGIMISTGTLTIIAFLTWIPITVLINRKLREKNWFPEVVQCFMFASAFLFIEAVFFAMCIYHGTTEDPDCPNGGADLGMVYFVLYFVMVFILFVFGNVNYFFLDLRRLYGFKSRTEAEAKAVDQKDAAELKDAVSLPSPSTKDEPSKSDEPVA